MILALSATMIFVAIAHCSNTVRRIQIFDVSILCKTSSWTILRPKLVEPYKWVSITCLILNAATRSRWSILLISSILWSPIYQKTECIFCPQIHLWPVLSWMFRWYHLYYWDFLCVRWIYSIVAFKSRYKIIQFTSTTFPAYSVTYVLD